MADDAVAAEPAHPLLLVRKLRQVALVGALAVLGYLGIAVLGDTDSIRAGLRQLGSGQWLILLGLSLLNYGLRFLRWHAFLQVLGARVPLAMDLRIYVAGFAFTVTPGKVGEAVRSVYLRAAGVPWSPGLAALAVERALDLAVMTMLAALALRVFADQAVPALLLVGLIAGLLVLITRPRTLRWLLGWLPKHGRLGQLARSTTAIIVDARVLLAPKRLLGGLGLGLMAWSAEAWGFYLLLHWLGVGQESLHAMGVYALSMLAGALSFLPGGLGGAEAAMVALLVADGTLFGTAVLATVICRAVTLWFAVVLGIGAVLMLGRRR